MRLTLKYPNGRSHQEIISDELRLTPGCDFRLHGHRWRAVAWSRPRSRYDRNQTSLLCENADPDSASGGTAVRKTKSAWLATASSDPAEP